MIPEKYFYGSEFPFPLEVDRFISLVAEQKINIDKNIPSPLELDRFISSSFRNEVKI